MKTLTRLSAAAFAASMILLSACGQKKASLDISFPEKYEGKTVELISYGDSSLISSAKITDGKALFETMESDELKFPLLAQLNVDGRTRAFYVIESGKAKLVADSMSIPSGTPLNEKFASLLVQMDSVENLNDMDSYTRFAEQIYNQDKEAPYAQYFGVEWLKYADPAKVDSMLRKAPIDFRLSRKTLHYVGFAKLRASTAVGKTYTDFPGEDAQGNPQSLAKFVVPGKYTLVDFMASWCPYCVKDLNLIKEIKNEYGPKGLNIVSVAVRDKPEDTRMVVDRHGMTWNVLYNAGRTPYDIYGFSGIPHYMLIDPEGKIVYRTETLKNMQKRIEEAYDE